jgi:uncharacterized repeat protein (TIGR01451 family)
MKRVLAFLLPWVLFAQAQVVTPFQIRYQTNDRGDIRLIGNTLMCARQGSSGNTCDIAAMNNPNANNNDYNMIFVNADPAAPTWDPGRGGSSAATLSLPPGAQVLFAGLYWGARADASASGRNIISLKPPGSTAYQTVTGTLLGTIGTSTTSPYAAFANVTGLVQSAGSGQYWVGGILAITGNPVGGSYAGWALVVVYKSANEDLRNLVVYDGLANLGSGNSVTITPSGFQTPLTGPVQARLGAVAFEGDGGLTGDQLLLNTQPLSDAQNPANNFFNSSVSDLGARFTSKVPDYVNQMAVDVDRVDATGRIPNGATSANVRFTTTNDGYYPAVLTFAVNLYVPDLKTTFTKTVSDLNGGQVQVGDVLEYTISFQNTGLDGATNVVLTDPIPAGTQYVPGSLQVTQNAGSPTGTFTDAAGDDIAEYDSANNRVVFRLGLGANASQGGLILPTQGATVKFRVQVLPSAAGSTVVNTAQVTYNAQTLGTAYTDTASAAASVTVAGSTLSGRVYHDLQPNGLREPGEDWSSGTLVYVNLVQGGSVVQSAAVSAGTGSFSFSGVVPGSYTLVLTNSASSTTPAPPSGWLFIEPSGGSRSLSVGSSAVSGQDFGLYHGSRISGTVFRDDGLGSGTANDALQNGGELGIAGVAVTASDGSQSRSTLSDSLGNYVLYVPHGFGPSLTLSHPLAPATGSNVGGGSVALATAYGQSAAQQRTLSFASGNLYDGYNFGVVRPSLWQPDQSGQATSPGVITYAHRVRPGTLGTLTFSRVGGNWNYLLRLDANCDGDFDDAGEGYQGLPYSLSVSGAWPREADGSLRACAVEVMVIVPAGLPAGSSDFLNLEARLRYANNPNNVDEGRTLTDTTVVGTGGELRLTKQVQNLTQSTPPSTGRAEGRPGEELEYCIAYQNQGASPITQVVLTDPIPFFTDYQAGSLRLGATPLSDAADGDAGEVVGGLVRVRIGTLAAGAGGQVCYRVKIR